MFLLIQKEITQHFMPFQLTSVSGPTQARLAYYFSFSQDGRKIHMRILGNLKLNLREEDKIHKLNQET